MGVANPQVAITNCGTSILAGCVVFPVLGFLAQELHQPLGASRKDLLRLRLAS